MFSRVKQATAPVRLALGLKLFRHQRPSRRLLALLHSGWGNAGWSGDTRYLEAVWRESLHARRILECGSGLSTLILGEVARKTGAEVYSLEHIVDWQKHVTSALTKRGLPNRVLYAPLKSYGEFDWYEVPASLPSGFDLVICDGPPSTTRGGRYGLLPLCKDRIERATILLDDAERSDEQQVMDRWRSEFAVTSSVVSSPEGAFARLAIGAATAFQ